MKVSHLLKGVKVEREIDSDQTFILTNKKGGYIFSGTNHPNSKFNGVFFPQVINKVTHEWDMFRTVEFLGIEKEATGIANTLDSVILEKDSSKEVYHIDTSDALVYDVSKYEGKIPLVVDMKFIYDSSKEGRIYSISKQRGCTIVSYEKYNNYNKEFLEYTGFLAIKTDMKIEQVESWIKREYELDKSRGDEEPAWTFYALNFLCKKEGRAVIAFGNTKTEAIKKALDIFEHHDYKILMKQKYVNSLSETKHKLPAEEMCAYKNALINYDSLICEINGNKGIYAGLPWFFQYWSRDEAISTIGLIEEENYSLAAKFLFRWLNISGDTRVSNRFPRSKLGSADGTGWVFFRLDEIIQKAQKKKVLEKVFSEAELYYIYKECTSRLKNIEDIYMRNGLITNEPLETWMDTGVEVGDLREGARIEIQALHIAMYNCIINLGKIIEEDVTEYRHQKAEFVETVKESFFINDYLFDAPNDDTMRPNVFIAAYVAPEILTKREWTTCFKTMLPSLYVAQGKLGGLVTITPESKFFCSHHSGKNNHSYHRGDRWYWVNCLAATVMARVNKRTFKKEIEGIKASSIHTILWQGAIGCFAEISSADLPTSEGCLSQAWSYATFIELINELNKGYFSSLTK